MTNGPALALGKEAMILFPMTMLSGISRRLRFLPVGHSRAQF